MSRLYNRKFVGEVAGNTLTIRAANPDPTSRYARHRELAAFVYEIAAALERMCEEVGTDIVVSPETFDRRIVLETVRDGDEAVAAELLQRVMVEHDLAGSAS